MKKVLCSFDKLDSGSDWKVTLGKPATLSTVHPEIVYWNTKCCSFYLFDFPLTHFGFDLWLPLHLNKDPETAELVKCSSVQFCQRSVSISSVLRLTVHFQERLCEWNKQNSDTFLKCEVFTEFLALSGVLWSHFRGRVCTIKWLLCSFQIPVCIWYDAPGYVAISVFAVHEMQPDWLTESPTYRPDQQATNQKRQNT